jgi:hypothetical protein
MTSYSRFGVTDAYNTSYFHCASCYNTNDAFNAKNGTRDVIFKELHGGFNTVANAKK